MIGDKQFSSVGFNQSLEHCLEVYQLWQLLSDESGEDENEDEFRKIFSAVRPNPFYFRWIFWLSQGMDAALPPLIASTFYPLLSILEL